MENSTKIYLLYHSGVAVETPQNLYIFDYYKDPAGVIPKVNLEEKDNVYVFVSHRHGDHFNREIFDWKQMNKNIKYILSSDIDIDRKEDYIFMAPDETLALPTLDVRTLGSTDLGVSFLVREANLSIFHAGDLNWWKWEKFSASKQLQEERDFKNEVNKLKPGEIDIAFIPVDPRLKKNYYLAGEYIAGKIKPDLLVPIHFGTDFEITDKFAEKISDYDTGVAVIEKQGQEIRLDK